MTEEAHSPWGGSSRKRYRVCKGSVALANRMPPEADSRFAWRGTVTHALAEHCLRNGDRDATIYKGLTDFSEAPGKKIIPVDAEMIATVNIYLDAVYDVLDREPNAELYVEYRFVLDVPAAPGRVHGKCDTAVYLPLARQWHFFDLKNGHDDVEVAGNEQAEFYAVGGVFGSDKPVSSVTLYIVQPNGENVDFSIEEEIDEEQLEDVVKSVTVEGVDMLEALAAIQREVAATIEAEKALDEVGGDNRDARWWKTWTVAGDHCRYCPARTACMARELFGIAAMVQAVPEAGDITKVTPVKLPLPSMLSAERIADILRAAPIFTDWLKMVQNHAQSLALAGTPIPGYKLVDKQARAKWAADPDRVSAYLSTVYGIGADKTMPPKLATISAVEKLLGSAIKDKGALKAAKDELRARYVDKSSSGLKLVPEGEKGEARVPPKALEGVSV